jgi:phosphoribulokinase
MARPVVLGVVGDSGAGKTTLTRGLVRVLGGQHVTHVSADDYHRFDRRQRADLGVSPLNPEANHVDILTQHLLHLRRGEAVLKPVYRHRDGTFGAPEYVKPERFLIVEGLLNFHTETLRSAHDVHVFLAPPEDLRRAWKVKRDCTRRGYTTAQVLDELDRRQADAESFIYPQRRHADMVISFRPGRDAAHLDAQVVLCDTLVHPDLTPLLDGHPRGPVAEQHEDGLLLKIPGDLDPERAEALEEAVWERMSFANHLRIRRLGEFTMGTDLLRSDSLALVQLLVLYQLVVARAGVVTGDSKEVTDLTRPRGPSPGADSALHA